ncbi:MAG TPA: archaeosortase/exosortase family protein [Candidatus Saccharimonadales bacterium]
MTFHKITTPLFKRVVIFLGLFVTISGLIGPRIIEGEILYRDGFDIYANFGKAAIFGLIAFWLLARRTSQQYALKAWQPILLLWLMFAVLFFCSLWLSVGSLLEDARTTPALITAHISLTCSVLCAALGTIGPSNLKKLWCIHKRPLLAAALIAVIFYLFLQAIYMLWQPLAAIVLWGVHSLLGLTAIATHILPPNILLTDKFGITIAEYCSGIESIALFSGLYIIMGLLERHRLRTRRYLILLPLALLVLFGINIVRIFMLIMAGYYINAEIAFSLFHTYAGMLLFIVYSAIFWALAYKHIIKPKEAYANIASN